MADTQTAFQIDADGDTRVLRFTGSTGPEHAEGLLDVVGELTGGEASVRVELGDEVSVDVTAMQLVWALRSALEPAGRWRGASGLGEDRDAVRRAFMRLVNGEEA